MRDKVATSNNTDIGATLLLSDFSTSLSKDSAHLSRNSDLEYCPMWKRMSTRGETTNVAALRPQSSHARPFLLHRLTRSVSHTGRLIPPASAPRRHSGPAVGRPLGSSAHTCRLGQVESFRRGSGDSDASLAALMRLDRMEPGQVHPDDRLVERNDLCRRGQVTSEGQKMVKRWSISDQTQNLGVAGKLDGEEVGMAPNFEINATQREDCVRIELL